MSLSGRSYSERERLDIYEERLAMYNACHGICAYCGKHVGMDEFQIAHRIPNSPTWLKKYGKEIIDNKLNKCVTHRGACNDLMQVTNKVVEREALVDRILEAIDMED